MPQSSLLRAVLAMTLVGVAYTPGKSQIESAPSMRFINIFETNPLLPVDLAKYPQFSVVGELELVETLQDGRVKTTMGSAVIVSPCLILTNHHVAFGEDFRPSRGKAYISTFRAGLGDQPGTFAGKTEAYPVAWGMLSKSGENDWAILRLRKCVGTLPSFGWAEYSRKTRDRLAAERVSIIVVGYSYMTTERGQQSMSRGSILGVDDGTGMMQINASITKKMSGGAVFSIEDGKLKLVGLVTLELSLKAGLHNSIEPSISLRGWDKQHSNLAQSTFDILYGHEVDALIATDKANWRPGNSALAKEGLQHP